MTSDLAHISVKNRHIFSVFSLPVVCLGRQCLHSLRSTVLFGALETVHKTAYYMRPNNFAIGTQRGVLGILVEGKLMTYTVTYDQPQGILRVIYSGAVTFDERLEAVEEVCLLYAHLRPLHILVNVRKLTMSLSFQEQQTFGDFIAGHPTLLDARVAVLHESGHNPNMVIDMSAFNNGYTLAQFNSTKEAEEWLRKS